MILDNLEREESNIHEKSQFNSPVWGLAHACPNYIYIYIYLFIYLFIYLNLHNGYMRCDILEYGNTLAWMPFLQPLLPLLISKYDTSDFTT